MNLGCLVTASLLATPCLAQSSISSADVSSSADVPFVMNSLDATYPLVAGIRGSYRIVGDSILVTIERGLLGNNVPQSYGSQGVLRELALLVGIGQPTETGWSVDTTGTRIPVADSLAPEASVSFEELVFVVRFDPSHDLGQRWLFFGLQGHHQGLFNLSPGRFSSYACDEDNLLGATRESLARAARMRTRYSDTC